MEKGRESYNNVMCLQKDGYDQWLRPKVDW